MVKHWASAVSVQYCGYLRGAKNIFALVIIIPMGRELDVGFLGVGAMNSFAVAAQGLHHIPLRMAGLFHRFRPGLRSDSTG